MSSFGSSYKISTFGESHCKSVGVVIDGVPAGLPLTEEIIQPQLSRRRPGQSNLTTPSLTLTKRDEKDKVIILSGTEMGFTLGTPICLIVNNQDQRPNDYSTMNEFPRPSHADYTYVEKYGVKASSGGGRSSARETIGRVAAAAVAEQYLKLAHNIEIVAFVSSVGNVDMSPHQVWTDDIDKDNFMKTYHDWWQLLDKVSRKDVDSTDVRCPDPEFSEKMKARIVKARDAHDSIGGTIVCVIRNIPAGLGEPCFDKLEAKLAHAMLSIPATKGFEIGSGFAGTDMPGHIHNDPFVVKDGKLGTASNFSGGVQGGISNGETIYFRIGFKPPATIGQAQETTNFAGSKGVLENKGRHDPCVLPRAVPIVESMAALVIMDALMTQGARLHAQAALPPSIRDDIPPVLKAQGIQKSDVPITPFNEGLKNK